MTVPGGTNKRGGPQGRSRSAVLTSWCKPRAVHDPSKILRNCRLKSDGVHHALLGIAWLHNLNLAA